jgi:hypothetical protein
VNKLVIGEIKADDEGIGIFKVTETDDLEVCLYGRTQTFQEVLRWASENEKTLTINMIW